MQWTFEINEAVDWAAWVRFHQPALAMQSEAEPGITPPAFSLCWHRANQPPLTCRLTPVTSPNAAPWRLQVAMKTAPEGSMSESLKAQAHTWVHQLLGLDQPVAAFETCLLQGPAGSLVQQLPYLWSASDLRLWLTPTPFWSGVRAILSQQISVKAANTVRARLIDTLASVSQEPPSRSAATLLQVSRETLAQVGLSATKTNALYALAEARLLPDDQCRPSLSAEQAHWLKAELIRLPGIGPWTADYSLVRGYGLADADLSGDQGVKVGLQAWWSLTHKGTDGIADRQPATQKQAAQWLAQFEPYRTQAAAFLWWLAAKGRR